MTKTVFPIEKIFEETSYKDRYRILCRRLVRERLYDAACFLAATSTVPTTIHEPDEELSFERFAAAIAGHITFVKSLPAPPGSSDQTTFT